MIAKNIFPSSTALAFLLLLTACAGVDSGAPQVTHDGLTLVPGTKFSEVYRKAGADIQSFEEFGLEPCKVAFKKNWLRDQNQGRVSLSNRVTQQDVDEIKDELSAICDDKFREVLLEEPAYNLVDSFDDGEAVLILRPSIIDLDVTAPDVQSASMNRSYTTSAGEMTLFLELVDATTGEILARAVDRRRGMDTGHLQWTSSVSNRSDASRALSIWAKTLRDGLDEARGN